MKVLVVEDELDILKRLVILMESEGFQVRTASTLPALDSLLASKVFYPNVIVLDRILGGEDSAQSIGKIKSQFADCKILILSAIDTATEKASLLNLGADDYLAKPFSTVELIARMKALQRRSTLINSEAEVRIGNLIINLGDRTIRANNEIVAFSQKEYLLLSLFASNPGKIFPRDILMNQVWNANADNASNVVEATVNNLRRKLEQVDSKVRVRNMRNVGYWLET